MREDDQIFEVCRLKSVRLQIHHDCLKPTRDEARAAEAHWIERTRDIPSFFNGTVYVLTAFECSGGRLDGVVTPVEFKTFLYWRDVAWPPGVWDVFGSAIVLSLDGAVLLGRPAPHTLNAGRLYFFGGFIDQSDVSDRGEINVEASARRELLEETGLSHMDVSYEGEMIMALSSQQMSLGCIYQAQISADTVRAQIRRYIEESRVRELDDVAVIRTLADAENPAIKAFTRAVLREILPQA